MRGIIPSGMRRQFAMLHLTLAMLFQFDMRHINPLCMPRQFAMRHLILTMCVHQPCTCSCACVEQLVPIVGVREAVMLHSVSTPYIMHVCFY